MRKVVVVAFYPGDDHTKCQFITEVMMAQITAYSIYRIVLVVIGVLIAAALVIGVIVLLHNRGEQVRNDQSTQLAEQEVKQEQKNVAKSTNTTTTTQAASTATNTTSTNTATVATTASTNTTTTALPVTGPSDSIVPFIAVALLTFATASYLVSRQRVKAL